MSEKKIKLSVLGFSVNQTQSGTYGLVLNEIDGNRRLMVIIGTPEAQSIAFQLQHTEPPRPLTHDLLCNLLNTFDIDLREVLIYKYDNGIFYSQLFLKQNNTYSILESRTSDAISIALRCQAPIYTTEEIMQELGIVINSENDDESDNIIYAGNDNSEYVDTYKDLSKDDLSKMLSYALEQEDYELASVLRDEIQKRD